jgi:hypothetical protein
MQCMCSFDCTVRQHIRLKTVQAQLLCRISLLYASLLQLDPHLLPPPLLHPHEMHFLQIQVRSLLGHLPCELVASLIFQLQTTQEPAQQRFSMLVPCEMTHTRIPAEVLPGALQKAMPEMSPRLARPVGGHLGSEASLAPMALATEILLGEAREREEAMHMAGPKGKRRRSREGSSSSSPRVYDRGCVSASVMMVRPDGGRSHAESGGSSTREIHERETERRTREKKRKRKTRTEERQEGGKSSAAKVPGSKKRRRESSACSVYLKQVR